LCSVIPAGYAGRIFDDIRAGVKGISGGTDY